MEVNLAQMHGLPLRPRGLPITAVLELEGFIGRGNEGPFDRDL